MNHHAPLRQEVSPVRMETMAAERAAFLSLALRERRESWRYRKWALEAKASGNTAKFHQYAAKARRYWRAAFDSLEHARRRNPS